MSEALDRIAHQEGFTSWSHLQSKSAEVFPSRYSEILDFFNPGDLVLVGARPSYGKTSFTIGLFVQAISRKRGMNYYFSLAETHKDVEGRMATYNPSFTDDKNFYTLDYSNEISADYIISKTSGTITKNSLIVVDYLQLLDEKRVNPPLQDQIEKLCEYAKSTGCMIAFLSQVAREIEIKNDRRPTPGDVRLPNPLNLDLFNKMIFLYREKLDSPESEVSFTGRTNHRLKVGYDCDQIKFY